MARGRIRDAVRTLLGRTEPQIEIARMRAQFNDLMVDVASALEKLNTMAARFAKRESRALERATTPQEPPPVEPEGPAGMVSSRKAELYRRARQLKQKEA